MESASQSDYGDVKSCFLERFPARLQYSNNGRGRQAKINRGGGPKERRVTSLVRTRKFIRKQRRQKSLV